MIASYSGAFAKPTLHHMDVAVAAPPQAVDGFRGQEALAVTEVGDAAAVRQQVYERKADAGFAVGPTGEMTISWPAVVDAACRAPPKPSAAPSQRRPACTATVEDVAPTAAGDPSGTVEFYADHLHLDRCVGWRRGLRTPDGRRTQADDLALRTMTLAGYSAYSAGT